MRFPSFVIGLSSIGLLVPALASAQAFEIFATTGHAQLWNDESRLGGGIPFGGGVGIRLPVGVGVEAIGEASQHARRFDSDVRFDADAIGFKVRVLKYFGRAGVQPYVGGGFGLTKFESVFDYPVCNFGVNNQFQCPTRDVHTSKTTSPTLSGFAGARIPVGRTMFVRPEAEFSSGGEHMGIGGRVAVGVGW